MLKIAIGVLLLAAAWFALSLLGAWFTVATLGFGMLPGLVIANGGFAALCIAIIMRGAREKGSIQLVLVPVCFFAIWFLVSIATRTYVSILASDLTTPKLEANLRLEKTLITYFSFYPNVSRKILADGHIDRLINIPSRGSIEETRHQAGAECSDKDKMDLPELQDVGRVDECFVTTILKAIPDGLVLRYIDNAETIGCRNYGCKDISIFTRSHGSEKLISAFERRKARVLSYLPFLSFEANHEGGIWSSGGGPVQIVSYGWPEMSPNRVLELIYGVDLAKPIAAPIVPPAELTRRAFELAKKGDSSSRRAAYLIAFEAQKQGQVDRNSLFALAAFVGESDFFLQDKQKPYLFVRSLKPQDLTILEDLIIERLTQHSDCKDCSFHERTLISSRDAISRAAKHFRNDRGLDPWQYEGLLRVAAFDSVWKRSEDAPIRAELFTSVTDAAPEDFYGKALAFGSVFERLDEREGLGIARRLADVRDADLGSLLFHTRFYPFTIEDGKAVPRPDQAGYRNFSDLKRKRIAIVSDKKLAGELSNDYAR